MKREPKKSVGVYSHVVFRLTFQFCLTFLFRFLFLRVWLVTSFHGVAFVSNILLFLEMRSNQFRQIAQCLSVKGQACSGSFRQLWQRNRVS